MGPLDENTVCIQLSFRLPHGIEHVHQQIGQRASTWGSDPMVCPILRIVLFWAVSCKLTCSDVLISFWLCSGWGEIKILLLLLIAGRHYTNHYLAQGWGGEGDGEGRRSVRRWGMGGWEGGEGRGGRVSVSINNSFCPSSLWGVGLNGITIGWGGESGQSFQEETEEWSGPVGHVS